MKKILMLVVILVAPCFVFGGVIEGNPDKCPSIGLNLRGIGASTDYTNSAGGLFVTTTGEYSEGWLLGDLRLPVSRNITLYGTLGFGGISTTVDENDFFIKQKAESGAFLFDVGIRFYLQ